MVDIGYKLNTMLNIKNINKLEGTMFYNRVLVQVVEGKDLMGNGVYSFLFAQIGSGKGWNRETEVRLDRNLNIYKGGYVLFVMGLASVTQILVNANDLKTKDGLALEISKTLAKAKHWWDFEASHHIK